MWAPAETSHDDRGSSPSSAVTKRQSGSARKTGGGRRPRGRARRRRLCAGARLDAVRGAAGRLARGGARLRAVVEAYAPPPPPPPPAAPLLGGGGQQQQRGDERRGRRVTEVTYGQRRHLAVAASAPGVANASYQTSPTVLVICPLAGDAVIDAEACATIHEDPILDLRRASGTTYGLAVMAYVSSDDGVISDGKLPSLSDGRSKGTPPPPPPAASQRASSSSAHAPSPPPPWSRLARHSPSGTSARSHAARPGLRWRYGLPHLPLSPPIIHHPSSVARSIHQSSIIHPSSIHLSACPRSPQAVSPRPSSC